MADRIKLAIIGCGGIAGAHLDGYEKLVKAGYDRFRIEAVCDTNPERVEAFADRTEKVTGERPAVFASTTDMLKESRLDAADICLPHAYHHAAGIACLERGVHVMIEKPCGITVKATHRIMDAAEKSGCTVAAAEQIRRCKGSRVIEWAINRERMIGTPRFFSMEVMGEQAFDWTSYAMAWRAVKLLTGGGMILDGGAHFTDMMLYVFGPVEEVYCTMRTFDTPTVDVPDLGEMPVDVEDTWLGTLRFESGLVGHWSWSRVAPGFPVRSGVYYGDQGSFKDRQAWMHAFQFGADLKLADGTEVPYEEIEQRYLEQLSPEEMEQLFPYGLDDGISNECWDFVEAIAEGRPPEIDAAAGLKAKSLCYALYESATLGRPIKVADVESGKVNTYQKPIDEYWEI